MGSRLLGWIITCAFHSLRPWEQGLIVWLYRNCFSVRCIVLPADTISSSTKCYFLNFGVFKEEQSQCLHQECGGSTCGMQVQPQSDWATEYSKCHESERLPWGWSHQLHAADAGAPRGQKIKRIASASALAVLSTAAAMVALSTTVTTSVLVTILPEDNDGLPVLSLLSPPMKMFKMSHQCQADC